jgi:ribonuclease G
LGWVGGRVKRWDPCSSKAPVIATELWKGRETEREWKGNGKGREWKGMEGKEGQEGREGREGRGRIGKGGREEGRTEGRKKKEGTKMKG